MEELEANSKIFELKNKEFTVREIVEYLNDNNYPRCRSKKPWCTAAVYQILNQPIPNTRYKRVTFSDKLKLSADQAKICLVNYYGCDISDISISINFNLIV